MNDIKNIIYDNSTNDQIKAIDHVDANARLLAGPGTGKTKTLTRRVLSLILNHKIKPDTIHLLTFTRKAAFHLTEEIEMILEPYNKTAPKVSTLHSFALSQILHNSSKIYTLPRPLRIADKWEERNIIQEDLRRKLKLRTLKDVKILIDKLSAGWATLDTHWEEQSPPLEFINILMWHKKQYGETLLAEFVYQLKKQLEQNTDFQFDKKYKHILVDEYQDLNACDLSVIKELEKRGAEIFAVGDDDQSIYGFRHASPDGIRDEKFDSFYPDAKKLTLKTCFRCDKKILKYAERVANLDLKRLKKPTQARSDAKDGKVIIIRCKDQFHEAELVAKMIMKLINSKTKPDKIAILLRSNKGGKLSRPIIDALKSKGIEVRINTDSRLSDNIGYREILSMIRLTFDKDDSLAWRTLLQVGKKNGLGKKCIEQIEAYAEHLSIKFGAALQSILINYGNYSNLRYSKKISVFVHKINCKVKAYKEIANPTETVRMIVDGSKCDDELKEDIKKHLIRILEKLDKPNLKNLIRAACSPDDAIEDEPIEHKENFVNLLTMHQAKGLTFDVCFIVGAEDESIPGSNTKKSNIGDELRLLYVSMTRAKHMLLISFCNERTGYQAFSGRKPRTTKRSLTRFLRHLAIEVYSP